MYVFNLGIKEFTQNFRPDAREVVQQLKEYLPKLPPKTVFYFETDGKSALGPRLPFFTSVPQALTVVYYDVSPLPDSFFDKPLFLGNPEGYQYADGRGFGFYTSKKELAKDLSSGLFSGENIHSFYYYAEKVKLKNTTWEIRGEMENFLKTEK